MTATPQPPLKSEDEEQEIEHLVAQYSKDPLRFIGTIQATDRSLDDAILAYRSTVIAIHAGKSNGVDIGEADSALIQFIETLMQQEAERHTDELLSQLEGSAVEYFDWNARLKNRYKQPWMAVPKEAISEARSRNHYPLKGEG